MFFSIFLNKEMQRMTETHANRATQLLTTTIFNYFILDYSLVCIGLRRIL